jgi:hypothetical protein
MRFSGSAVRVFLAVVFCLGLGWAQEPGEIRGIVLDVRGGEPLARVQVQLLGTDHQAVTDAQGRFSLPQVPPGDYLLHVSTVGYRLLKKPFTLAAGEVRDFEIALSPESLRRTETIEVRAGPFELEQYDSPSQVTLAGPEAKNLASVLADDPLRAVQGLPGVASNDDFESRFSVRGADYHRVGLYVDDILLHTPFHSVQGEPASGTLTIFNGDTLEDISLHGGAYPVRYADRTAAVLDVHSREGSRVRPSIRGTASASNAGLLAEGPLGRNRRGAWLAGVRKSYLQYILRRTVTDPSLAFGFLDGTGRVSYDLSRAHHLSLSVLDGFSDLDRSRARDELGANSINTSNYHFTLPNLAWRYAPHERFLLTNRLAYMREKFTNRNREDLDLVGGHYGEYVWSTTAHWVWRNASPLEAGWTMRRLRDDGFTNYYQFNPLGVQRLDEYRGTGIRTGGFVQQSWSGLDGRLDLSVGLRWDRYSVNQIQAASPQASAAILLRPSTRIHLGWGQYVQYPEIRWLFSSYGNQHLLPERATHAVVGLEQRLDERTRLRLEFFQRQDRDLLFRPFYEPRLLGDEIFNPPVDAPIANSVRGYARGFEIFLHRRSANGLTGWISYTLGYARLRDGPTGISFPSDQDQRHSVNVYLSYRLRPTVNLSAKWIYGSGFPVPGFLRREGDEYYLAASRNNLRLDPYQRFDARINKACVFDRWKLTLYAEVINLLNRRNRRFDSFNGYNPVTGQAYLSFSKMFPILPSVGVALEY